MCDARMFSDYRNNPKYKKEKKEEEVPKGNKFIIPCRDCTHKVMCSICSRQKEKQDYYSGVLSLG